MVDPRTAALRRGLRWTRSSDPRSCLADHGPKTTATRRQGDVSVKPPSQLRRLGPAYAAAILTLAVAAPAEASKPVCRRFFDLPGSSVAHRRRFQCAFAGGERDQQGAQPSVPSGSPNGGNRPGSPRAGDLECGFFDQPWPQSEAWGCKGRYLQRYGVAAEIRAGVGGERPVAGRQFAQSHGHRQR